MNCKKQICSPLHIFYIRVDLYIKHGVRMMMLFMEIHFIYKPLRSEEKKKENRLRLTKFTEQTALS